MCRNISVDFPPCHPRSFLGVLPPLHLSYFFRLTCRSRFFSFSLAIFFFDLTFLSCTRELDFIELASFFPLIHLNKSPYHTSAPLRARALSIRTLRAEFFPLSVSSFWDSGLRSFFPSYDTGFSPLLSVHVGGLTSGSFDSFCCKIQCGGFSLFGKVDDLGQDFLRSFLFLF